jgi:hypothetical protein
VVNCFSLFFVNVKKERKMKRMKSKPAPWYLWPFLGLWRLIARIVGLTGRLVAVVLGLALMIVGVVLSVTIIGAVAGVPLAVVGLLLVLKGIF